MNQRFIGPAFIVSILCGLAFCVLYISSNNAQLQGILLGGSFGGIGVGMILWAKHLMPDEEVEQDRHDHHESTPEEQQQFFEMLESEAANVNRRGFLAKLGGAALGVVGLAAIFPLKSLGPNPGNSLFRTDWKKGSRLLTPDGRPVKASALSVGGVLTVFPEGVKNRDSAATLLIKVATSGEFKPRKGREDWAPEGNVAYSKVCTHVGCPVGLYRETTKELLCPCHQSTFDVLDGARPVFGPAARSLPQLPLAVDSDGYLIAQSDYREPVGPGFWNRGRKKMEA